MGPAALALPAPAPLVGGPAAQLGLQAASLQGALPPGALQSAALLQMQQQIPGMQMVGLHPGILGLQVAGGLPAAAGLNPAVLGAAPVQPPATAGAMTKAS